MAPGLPVRLVISQGGVEVPDVLGRKLEEAERRLREAGLEPLVEGAARKDDDVTEQNPPPGTLVAPGSAVSLTVEQDDDDDDDERPTRGRGRAN